MRKQDPPIFQGALCCPLTRAGTFYHPRESNGGETLNLPPPPLSLCLSPIATQSITANLRQSAEDELRRGKWPSSSAWAHDAWAFCLRRYGLWSYLFGRLHAVGLEVWGWGVLAVVENFSWGLVIRKKRVGTSTASGHVWILRGEH